MNAALQTQSVAVMQHHARSFSLAAWFLPKAGRQHAATLYHLCRLVDDLADESTDALEAWNELDKLVDELTGRAPGRPLVQASLEVLNMGALGVRPAVELIRGVQGDLGPVRMADEAALLEYCYQVAGTVGLMMLGPLGVSDPRAMAFAVDLGLAMQLTNISRDVAEDAMMNRVYLPETWLRLAGTSGDALIADEPDRSAVASVVEDLLQLADRYYASAREGMAYIPLRSRAAILVASGVYRGIGGVLQRRGFDALRGRAIVSPTAKAGHVLVGLMQAPWLSLRPTPPHHPSLHLLLGGLPGVDAGSHLRPQRLSAQVPAMRRLTHNSAA